MIRALWSSLLHLGEPEPPTRPHSPPSWPRARNVSCKAGRVRDTEDSRVATDVGEECNMKDADSKHERESKVWEIEKLCRNTHSIR